MKVRLGDEQESRQLRGAKYVSRDFEFVVNAA